MHFLDKSHWNHVKFYVYLGRTNKQTESSIAPAKEKIGNEYMKIRKKRKFVFR